MYPTFDHDLARRLERAEGAANAAYVEARDNLQPQVGARWIDVAGAYAMFDGIGSPLTQTFGVGMFEPFLEGEFCHVERFFRVRGSATFHEICSFAAPETSDLLASRDYVPVEDSVVLVRPTDGADEEPPAPDITVRPIASGEVGCWSRVAARGWSSESPQLAAFVEQIGQVTATARGVHCFFAELDGSPVAAAALNLSEGIAVLAGASTIPEARKRGAQQALLKARLRLAADLGYPLAMVVTQPGSASQRNAERQGFRPAYTRKKWRLATGQG